MVFNMAFDKKVMSLVSYLIMSVIYSLSQKPSELPSRVPWLISRATSLLFCGGAASERMILRFMGLMVYAFTILSWTSRGKAALPKSKSWPWLALRHISWQHLEMV